MNIGTCLVIHEADLARLPGAEVIETGLLLGNSPEEQRAEVVLYVQRDGTTRVLKNRHGMVGTVVPPQ